MVLVDAPIQRDLTHWFLVFPGQGYYLGFEFLGVYPPCFVLLSHLFLLLHYISRLFLYLPDGVRSTENWGYFRKIAMTVAKADKESKDSVKSRVKQMAWSDDYLERLLFHSSFACEVPTETSSA
jgi:hypothetical protein